MSKLHTVWGTTRELMPISIGSTEQSGRILNTISQIKIEDLKLGDILQFNAQATISVLKNGEYPGFPYSTFSGSQVFLSRIAQGLVANRSDMWAGGQAGGMDINSKDADPSSTGFFINPYVTHTRNGFVQIDAGMEGTWYVVFACWCASTRATSKSRFKTINSQAGLQVLVHPQV